MKPHRVLGIAEDATLEEAKKAYHLLARRWHPDRNPGKDTTVKMQQINEAYEEFCNNYNTFNFGSYQPNYDPDIDENESEESEPEPEAAPSPEPPKASRVRRKRAYKPSSRMKEEFGKKNKKTTKEPDIADGISMVFNTFVNVFNGNFQQAGAEGLDYLEKIRKQKEKELRDQIKKGKRDRT
jgi:curved DNA-binding protein CbpA